MAQLVYHVKGKPCRRSCADGINKSSCRLPRESERHLCYIDKPLIHAFRGPKASGSSILSSKSVTKRFSEKLLLSFPINRAQLHCWSGFFRGRSKPSGPGWHGWSGCVASLALNQTGRGGTVGRSFFVFQIKCTYVPLPLSLEV